MTKEVEGIDPALVARMVNLLRQQVDTLVGMDSGIPAVEEARAIVSALPKPAEPDLLVARQLVRDTCLTWAGNDWNRRVMRGDEDDSDRVKVALAAIKRGRELAQVSA